MQVTHLIQCAKGFGDEYMLKMPAGRWLIHKEEVEKDIKRANAQMPDVPAMPKGFKHLGV